ncbi:RagB/SusD family nutrient uptake outer membrane protein [Flammeovirga aprica]|uniref:RagB/SusD family nutrient uptake outer membrane protein n=1 Tax=Flammeovirga aprica JL-4 TaxID=694437 RepID=A0A7X9RYD9_9BACT|nr:RagB/SusD family nutrient uptake outer membrane protein [Flammeovirga aprica]NME71025.1 RagB/SusD family nutrient uptake outer membrane protein [Flammeovirga aprica JL-4]
MKIRLYILIVLSSLFASCEQYLEGVEGSIVTDEEIFSNYNDFRAYLDYGYKGLFNYHLYKQNTAISTVSDQFQCPSNTAWQDYAQYVNTGNYDNSAGAFEVGWAKGNGYGEASTFYNAMTALRVANKIIQETEIASTVLSEGQRKDLRGQAFFLRAFYHFELIKRYGGMHYIDRVYEVDEDLDFERLSYEETTQRIIKDCDEAVELLAANRSGIHYGRATSTMAQFLKGMALLYDASPTMNIANGYGNQYHEDKCKVAAEEIANTIKMAQNAGFVLVDGKSFKDYAEIFYSRDNVASTECIFPYIQSGFIGYGSTLKQLYIPRSFGLSNNRYTLATHNLVRSFETINGLDINDDPEYDPQNPYKNRDPRLEYSVLHHGQQHGIDVNGAPRILDFSYDEAGNPNQNGIDITGAGSDLVTGYYMRKFWPETANPWQQDGSYFMNWNYMRLTQAYLDYAEAVNEAYGPTGTAEGSELTAIAAINMVRERVGMPPVNSMYTQDKVTFRKRIWNERSVELNGEFQRWWDMRRWHIAHLSENKQIKGMKVTRNNETGDERYEIIDVVGTTRVFEEKHYWYPWPRDVIFMSDKFKQNPGW